MVVAPGRNPGVFGHGRFDPCSTDWGLDVVERHPPPARMASAPILYRYVLS